MLTGSATPFLHNGIMTVEYNEENNFDFGEGKVGITNRNDIGFLFWDTNPKLTQAAGLGSRLKTPVLPIWVTCVNGNWGVLFNPNKDLMKSYAAENRLFIHNTLQSSNSVLFRFNLYYFSNTAIKEKRDTIILIDTRNTVRAKANVELNDDFDVIEENPLEKAIQSK